MTELTAPQAELILDVNHVSFTYGEQLVLEDVTLPLYRGDFLGLIGPNGSGKTTLLKLMLGLLKPQRGHIRWFSERPNPGRFRQRVAYVPQLVHAFDQQFPATVAEVVASGRAGLRGLFHRFQRYDWQAVDDAMELVGIAELRDQRISQLSGGQQQRAYIARALAAQPEVLLMDEPTAGIDIATQERFYQLLGRLHQQYGLTLVMVSHDVSMIAQQVTQLACLNHRLFYHGDIDGFMADVHLQKVYGDMQLVAHHHHHH